MLNKKIFVLIGVFVFFAAIYFVFNRESKQDEDEVSLVVVNDEQVISQENIEEAKKLFLEIEKSFYNILESIFLMGDNVTKLLAEEIVEIENNLKNVKEGLDEETISNEELYESLSIIQIKIHSLTEKLIELDS